MCRRKAVTSSRIAVAGLLLLGVVAAPATAQKDKPSGAEIWAASCSRCHRSRAVDVYNASQWDAVVTHMALTARLTPDEEKSVRQFLVGSAQARESAARAPAGAPPAAEAPRNVPAPGQSCAVAGGAEIFKAQCAICHGAEGRGDGPISAGRAPNITDAVRMAAISDDSLVTVVTRGRNAMPGFGQIIEPGDIRRVVAYLRCLGEAARSPGTGEEKR